MTRSHKSSLLASVAGLVLAAGLAASPAKAFDYVDWSFTLAIDPTENIAINIDSDSMTAIEVEQKFGDDVTATSKVIDIYVKTSSPNNLDAAADLGRVVSEATAVGNNINVASNTEAVFLHSLQRGYDDVRAKSIVYDIDNLTVDSSATAIGNNAGMNVDTVNEIGNTNVAAEIDQKMGYNDEVSALSRVKDVTIKGYAGMGVAGVNPVVNSVATAVANNVNVSVSRVVAAP